jgi:hypothetical protein
MMATGNLMGINTEKNVMKAFVQSELFPKVKFLQPEDLSATGIVSNMVRRHMNYKKHDWGGDRECQQLCPLVHYFICSHRVSGK